MDIIPDVLKSLYPNFPRARRERRKVRRRCRENLVALKHEGHLSNLTHGDVNLEYLNKKAENHLVEANHLINSGSKVGHYSHNINQDHGSELREELQDCVSQINRQNYISLITQLVLILFVVGVLALAVIVGIAGLGTLVTEIQNLA